MKYGGMLTKKIRRTVSRLKLFIGVTTLPLKSRTFSYKLSERIGGKRRHFCRAFIILVMKTSLEERMARVEGISGQMDKRLNHLESELRDLRNELRSELRDLRRDLNHRFFWLLSV